jgi:hypothetical protein
MGGILDKNHIEKLHRKILFLEEVIDLKNELIKSYIIMIDILLQCDNINTIKKILKDKQTYKGGSI